MLLSKRHMPGLTALILLSGMAVLSALTQGAERGGAVRFDSSQLPCDMAGWTFVRQISMAPTVHKMLDDDASQWHTYRRGSQRADLLVLYGHRKRTFHLPESCLAGAGMAITARQPVALKIPGSSSLIPFHALVLQKDGVRSLALYTFVGPDGRPTDLLGLNLDIFMCRVRGQSPKGAVIRVIGPMDPNKQIDSQDICGLAAATLREVGQRVRSAGSSPSARAADARRAGLALSTTGGPTWREF